MPALAALFLLKGFTTPPPLLCPQFTPFLPGSPTTRSPPDHTGRKLGGGDVHSRICYSCSVTPHKSLTSCLFLIFFLLRKKRSKGLGADGF